MKLPSLPAKLYFASFLIIALGLYSFFNVQLYFNAESFRNKTQEKAQTLALAEMNKWIQLTVESDENDVAKMTHWDEVFQQLDDPSYYFFWHEGRLQESEYWRPHFKDLELFDATGNRLMPPMKENRNLNKPQTLPLKSPEVDTPQSYFTISGQSLEYITFHPIFGREGSGEIVGYIGVSTDFLRHFYQVSQLTYVDKTTLQVKYAAKPIKLYQKELLDHLEFTPSESPIDNFLWGLIQDFIFEVISAGLLVGLVFFAFFRLSTLRPLGRLSDYLLDLKNHPDTLIEPPRSDFMFNEFETLKSTLFQYHQQLFKAKTEIEKQNQIASELARVDALSNAYNRRAFDEQLEVLHQTFTKDPQPVAFILFDCDFFKAINDSYGHETGDDVIRISAKTFQENLPKEFPLFRIGGDEFVSIIVGEHKEKVIDMAETCLKAISDYDFSTLGIQEKISYSIGLSILDDKGADAKEIDLLHKQADIALITAKKSLHQKIQFYDPKMKLVSESLVSTDTINAIINAIHTGEGLKLHYQNIQDADEEKAYAEVLMRIEANGKTIYPYEIFQVIEHRGLEVELDKQVVSQVLRLLRADIIKQQGVSINLSAHTLLRENLCELFDPLQPFLNNYKIVVEVLEGTLIENLDMVAEKLNRLRDKGFMVALDDFGSGYSSIRYLAKMPVDVIKFDLSLTHALEEDAKTVSIIKHTATMIREAGYFLVMEGIETESQKEKAIAAGATHLQGFFFQKPTPFEENV